MVADIAAVGNPGTGVAMYQSNRNMWIAIGGTSVSAPIIVGIAGLYGISDPSWPYSHANAFFDVTSGSNSSATNPTCKSGTTNYQCNGVAGYDGPTGLGTPNAAMFGQPPPAMDGGRTTGAGGAGGGGTTGAGGRSGTTGAGGATTSGAGGASTTGGGSGVVPVGTGGATTGGDTTGGSTTSGSGGDPTGGTTTGDPPGSTVATGSTVSSGSGVLPKGNQGDSGCSCRVGATSTKGQDLAGLVVLGLGLIGARRSRSGRSTWRPRTRRSARGY
jgi:MYXO-CTERM domain-containing protein